VGRACRSPKKLAAGPRSVSNGNERDSAVKLGTLQQNP
jgi:hypothetical protein